MEDLDMVKKMILAAADGWIPAYSDSTQYFEEA